ncbi:hypothetical protein MIZ03_0426 [Rhodoferax lithotrophicus]|uniref:Uncharacterized protein n=1 Tax=Rhodoferax lithotrophicus TaxID=2798804 RepID=A0ABN6D0J3_9BURK|nr:hypothetical protein [Rhodoferax sp. MIZ03]BCO25565.1 hypothetical protein MIZ03_0426 [Rhodoferax sp. MIZ03]
MAHTTRNPLNRSLQTSPCLSTVPQVVGGGLRTEVNTLLPEEAFEYLDK